MKTGLQRSKWDLEIYALALREIARGNHQPAEDAIGLGQLRVDQLVQGCIARLKAAYNYVHGYGPRKNVKQSALVEAYEVLGHFSGVTDLIAPEN